MKKVKILLIGDFTGKGDEGLSQISKSLSKLLIISNIVLNVNTKEIIRLNTIYRIIKFKPTIIHYVTGPTLRSFIILAFLKILFLSPTKIFISATRPFIKKKYFKLLKFFPIDLVFTQAEKWETIFKNANFKTRFLPNPIDTSKFQSRASQNRELRKKYDLPIDKKIILHVGHIKENRNLKILLDITSKFDELGFCVVLISSTFLEQDDYLYKALNSAGIIIRREYFKDINELYELADVYLFPVRRLEKEYFPKTYNEIGVIDMPMSLLEALSVGVPVLTTHIDAIENLQSKCSQKLNITYYDGSPEGMINSLQHMDLNYNPNNEELIKMICENNIKSKILDSYSNVIAD